MRHYSINPSERVIRADRNRVNSSSFGQPRPEIFKAIFGLLFFLIAGNQLVAQQNCSIACSGAVNVKLDNDCAVEILPNQILSAPPPCPGTYTLFLTTAAGDTVPGNIVTGLYLNKTLTATVFHEDSGNSCWGLLAVSDKTSPVLTCPNVSVSCNQSMDPSVTGLPQILDNCQNTNFTILPHNDGIMQNGTCTDTFIKRTLRVWHVLDASGNQGNCAQMISVKRPKLTDLVFPPQNVTIAVGTVANPAVTGFPTISGLPIDQVACNLLVNSFDSDTLPVCFQNGKLVEYKIIREWLVLENCNNQLKKETQIISVKDMTAPFLVCPPATTVSTVIDECFGNISSLPFPTVSAPDSVAVSWQFGQNFGPFDSIPTGVYDLVYTAFDCSHTVNCTTKITIKDTQTPTPVLIANQVIGLSSVGITTLPASHFNVGSFDNCDDVVISVSRTGVNFLQAVTFNCADVGSQIMVTVRVSELNNSANYTDAMVAITVQDKQAPFVKMGTMPKDITVDCEYDYANPTLGGSNDPVFLDNCGIDTVIFELQINVALCKGSVKRIFTAFDVNGNSTKIVQTVTVENLTPFQPSQITWPLNFQTNVCGASLNQNDMQQPFKEPVFSNPGCAQLGTDFKDEIFNAGNLGCSKIYRKWTVVDWCEYNPNFPNAGGRWTFTQVLQVMDGKAPELVAPADLTVSVGNDCLKGAVVLPDATATDCSNLLMISHNSQHATAPGANISGNYPLGIHNITVKASDGCGNVSQKIVKISVLDNVAPTALCMNGLSASLNQMAGGVMLMVNATAFDAGSFDHCTATNKLIIGVKKGNTIEIPAPVISFNCDDKGFQLIEMHVTDAKGNTGKCLTYILVQDNANLCPTINPNLKANISGQIATEKGDKVQNVAISIPNFLTAVPVNSDAAGLFAIPNLPKFGNYDVKPEKDGDDLNGLTSYDILMINRHILGVTPLVSPYQIIAADVNHSGTVTTADVLEARKVLLGIFDSLPHNTSWRFVDKNFVFTQPTNPFLDTFPEVKSIANLSADTAAQFVGIKIGDVNQSAQTNSLGSSDDRNERPEIEILAADQTYDEGDLFAFSLKMADRQEIGAMTFTLEFDPEKISFEDWAPGSLPNLTDGNLNFLNSKTGKITFVWTDINGVETAPGQTLLMLQGTARAATKLSEAIRFSERPTRLEAYGPDGEEMNLALHFTRADGSTIPAATAYELYQNKPNPFSGETNIGFHLPTEKSVTLSIFDAAGRLVFEQKRDFGKGKNEWLLPANSLPQHGVFSYRVSTDDWSATKKMVKW